MQVTELKNEKLKQSYTVSFTEEQIEEKVSAELQQIAKTIKIDGFRPGKVPVHLVRQRHEADARQDVLSKIVQESTDSLVKDKNLSLAMRPSYDIKEAEKGFSFDVSFDLLPSFDSLKIKDIALDYYEVKIEDKQVDEALKTIGENNQDSAPIKTKRKSKKGDVLLIDFVGKINDEAFKGGSAEGHKLELGSGSFIPGFEDQLMGKSAGDKVDVKVTFPTEYTKDLAGKDAVFHVTIHEIHEKVAPKMDDEFAKRFGLESLNEMKKSIGDSLAKEYESMSKEHAKQDVLNFLNDHYTFELPERMVDQEYHGICHRLAEEETKGKGYSPEEMKKKEKQWSDEYRPIAERRVKLGLILAQVAKDEGVRVGKKELEEEVLKNAYSMPGREKEVISFYEKNPQAVEGLRAPLLEAKVINHIIDTAKVTKKSVSSEELSAMLKKRDEEMENMGKKKKK